MISILRTTCTLKPMKFIAKTDTFIIMPYMYCNMDIVSLYKNVSYILLYYYL